MLLSGLGGAGGAAKLHRSFQQQACSGHSASDKYVHKMQIEEHSGDSLSVSQAESVSAAIFLLSWIPSPP